MGNTNAIGTSQAHRGRQAWGEDDILWAECNVGPVRLKFFVISPYLAANQGVHGRLVYSTEPPFGVDSIGRVSNGTTWYKVIHRNGEGRRISVPYADVLSFARKQGFQDALGVHRQLSMIPSAAIGSLEPSPSAVERYGDCAEELLQDIARFYDVGIEELRLTGSAAALDLPFDALDDLDVVVPVHDEEHLRRIALEPRPRGMGPVPLGPSVALGLRRAWAALRWRHPRGMIVCPFFTFGRLRPPAIDVRETGTRVRGRIRITSAIYGSFNTQFYECSGAMTRLMICSTFGRGETRAGSEFDVDCPVYEVLTGAWSGAHVAVANSPYLGLTEGALTGS